MTESEVGTLRSSRTRQQHRSSGEPSRPRTCVRPLIGPDRTGDELKSIKYCRSAGCHLFFITADSLSCDRSLHICEEEIKETRSLGRRAPLMLDFQWFLLVLVNVGVANSQRGTSRDGSAFFHAELTLICSFFPQDHPDCFLPSHARRNSTSNTFNANIFSPGRICLVSLMQDAARELWKRRTNRGEGGGCPGSTPRLELYLQFSRQHIDPLMETYGRRMLLAHLWADLSADVPFCTS